MIPSRSRPRLAQAVAALSLAALLGACSTAESLNPFSGKKSADLPEGERISVLTLDVTSVQPDSAIANIPVALPPVYRNTDWPQPGGYPAHAMYHLEVGPALKLAWTRDVGAGSSSSSRLVTTPVIANGGIYVMDTQATVRGFAVADGKPRWSVNLTPKDEDSPIGFLGGLAYDSDVVYAATGYGEVIALSAADGSEKWRKQVGIPFRAAPTVNGGRVFATTQDNQLYALSTTDGEVLWNHVGIAESAGFLGAASPAVAGEAVVVPFSSGELFALRVENGRVVWSDTLTRGGVTTPLDSLNDIRGQVVLDRGVVFATSHGGRTVGIELRTGLRLWDRSIGSSNTPWVGGDVIYVLSDDNLLICLTRNEGRVRWTAQLPRYTDPEGRSGTIVWYGPVLAGDRLLLSSNIGLMTAVSPYTGDTLGNITLPGGAASAPIVADATVYVLLSSGTLAALR